MLFVSGGSDVILNDVYVGRLSAQQNKFWVLRIDRASISDNGSADTLLAGEGSLVASNKQARIL